MALDTELPHVTSLLEEIERYLAAVEAFRAEGCSLEWIDDPEVR